ncbi:MAG: CDP-alcohol phosphatidyltransferase family protein [Acidobacteria bacterium]|nr:CDP-alcohol phosphatidyltransferase family protein [Acidobacteriota bacterium]
MVEQAVILADLAVGSERAGAADRVLLGLGLLQRMVLTLAQGGIRHILVLVREGGTPGAKLAHEARGWQDAAASVKLAGMEGAELPLPQAPFLLLDGMIVFDAAWVARIRQCQVAGERILVGGDPRRGQAYGYFHAAGDRAVSAGAGPALCPAASFPQLLAALAGGPGHGGTGARPAGTQPPEQRGNGWVRVHSRGDERWARRLLRLSLGKPSDGFFSRHLNRRISWPISRLLIGLRVSPNQVTLANLALGLLSGWLIGRGGYANTLAAGLLFQFVSIADGCDGEIARLTFRFSPLGARLDNLCDLVVLIVFFLNLPLGLSAATADSHYLVMGALQVLLVAVFYLLLLARIRLSRHRGNIAEMARQVQEKNKEGRKITWLEWLGVRLGFIYRKEFISLYAMIWCVVGRAEVFLWTTVGLTSVGLVYQLDAIVKLLARRRTRPT